MDARSKNLQTLEELNKNLNKDLPAVQEAKITSPAREMEETITDFLANRLAKLSEDTQFENAIKNNILARLPEASFKELTELLHNVSQDNALAANGTMEMFKPAQGEKTIIDTLRSDAVSNAATEVYNSIDDKNVLQSLNYLNQILTQLSSDKQ